MLLTVLYYSGEALSTRDSLACMCDYSTLVRALQMWNGGYAARPQLALHLLAAYTPYSYTAGAAQKIRLAMV